MRCSTYLPGGVALQLHNVEPAVRQLLARPGCKGGEEVPYLCSIADGGDPHHGVVEVVVACCGAVSALVVSNDQLRVQQACSMQINSRGQYVTEIRVLWRCTELICRIPQATPGRRGTRLKRAASPAAADAALQPAAASLGQRRG